MNAIGVGLTDKTALDVTPKNVDLPENVPTFWKRVPSTPWVAFFIAFLIVGLAAVGIDTIQDFSASRRHSVVILKTLEGLVHRLSALEWEIAAQGIFPTSMQEEVNEIHGAFTEAISEIIQIQTSAISEEVVQSSLQYDADIAHLFQLYLAGKLDEAAAWDEVHVDPSYQDVLQATSTASVFYSLEANRADTIARISSWVILGLAAITFGMLSQRFQRAQRLIDLLGLRQHLVEVSEQRYRTVVGNASDVIVICETDGTMREPSQASVQVFGCSPVTLIGKNIRDLVHPDDHTRIHHLLVNTLDNPAINVSSELRMQHTDGAWRFCEVIFNNLVQDPNILGIVATCRNITERRKFEEELTQLAFHDLLTNLPNRTLFLTCLQRALLRTKHTNCQVAVLFLDLDNFKLINDSLGHHLGDQLLIAAAKRLQSCVRPIDTVARLGGDEFTILLEDINEIANVIQIVEKIYEGLHSSFTIDGHELYISTSIGIALGNFEVDSPTDILRDADLAMYRAKSNGKAHYALFDRSLTYHAQERLELETDLRHAVERGELRIHYQPIIDLGTSRITEMEALVRWMHPKRGLIYPAQFIHIAEETGLILPIGQWVLREACRQAVVWQNQHPHKLPLVMSVNLSPRQFQQTNLVEMVNHCLQETRLPPQSLKLEITESMLMQDSENTETTLCKLKLLGVKLAIDDFGTGYCSLNYLKRFPVDTLKIDRSFIAGLGHNAEDTAIVRAIVAFGKALTLNITGEGIETQDQLEQLASLECEQGQGYYFSRPLSSDSAATVLAMEAISA